MVTFKLTEDLALDCLESSYKIFNDVNNKVINYYFNENKEILAENVKSIITEKYNRLKSEIDLAQINDFLIQHELSDINYLCDLSNLKEIVSHIKTHYLKTLIEVQDKKEDLTLLLDMFDLKFNSNNLDSISDKYNLKVLLTDSNFSSPINTESLKSILFDIYSTEKINYSVQHSIADIINLVFSILPTIGLDKFGSTNLLLETLKVRLHHFINCTTKNPEFIPIKKELFLSKIDEDDIDLATDFNVITEDILDEIITKIHNSIYITNSTIWFNLDNDNLEVNLEFDMSIIYRKVIYKELMIRLLNSTENTDNPLNNLYRTYLFLNDNEYLENHQQELQHFIVDSYLKFENSEIFFKVISKRLLTKLLYKLNVDIDTEIGVKIQDYIFSDITKAINSSYRDSISTSNCNVKAYYKIINYLCESVLNNYLKYKLLLEHNYTSESFLINSNAILRFVEDSFRKMDTQVLDNINTKAKYKLILNKIKSIPTEDLKLIILEDDVFINKPIEQKLLDLNNPYFIPNYTIKFKNGYSQSFIKNNSEYTVTDIYKASLDSLVLWFNDLEYTSGKSNTIEYMEDFFKKIFNEYSNVESKNFYEIMQNYADFSVIISNQNSSEINNNLKNRLDKIFKYCRFNDNPTNFVYDRLCEAYEYSVQNPQTTYVYEYLPQLEEVIYNVVSNQELNNAVLNRLLSKKIDTNIRNSNIELRTSLIDIINQGILNTIDDKPIIKSDNTFEILNHVLNTTPKLFTKEYLESIGLDIEEDLNLDILEFSEFLDKSTNYYNCLSITKSKKARKLNIRLDSSFFKGEYLLGLSEYLKLKNIPHYLNKEIKLKLNTTDSLKEPATKEDSNDIDLTKFLTEVLTDIKNYNSNLVDNIPNTVQVINKKLNSNVNYLHEFSLMLDDFENPTEITNLIKFMDLIKI